MRDVDSTTNTPEPSPAPRNLREELRELWQEQKRRRQASVPTDREGGDHGRKATTFPVKKLRI